MKEIPNFSNYYADEDGNIYSNFYGKLKKLTPWLDGKKNYLQVGLMKDGKRHRLLVHRLIALTFIENPFNLPEVNHKDKNKLNCCVENLEWCTRKDNLIDSYSTMSPTRNFKQCSLYVNNTLVKNFNSIKDACKFASKEYNVSFSSLYKNLKIKNIEIIKN